LPELYFYVLYRTVLIFYRRQRSHCYSINSGKGVKINEITS